MKGKTHPELIILYERGYTIKQLLALKKWKRATVYNYSAKWQKARALANDIMVVG